jgi:uncharacterized protein YndB with AHSA1/START domain
MNQDRHPLVVRQTFAVDPERAFRAWSDPRELRRWFSPVGFTTPHVEADVRPGGRYRIGMQPPEGNAVYVRGEYREVRSPERLVFTWSWEEGDAVHRGETLVTVEFRAVPAGTEVVLTHEMLPGDEAAEMHAQGWNGCLASLREHLATTSSTASRTD